MGLRNVDFQSKQAVFDYSVACLLKQEKGSYIKLDGNYRKIACRYWMPSGEKCAAGHLIPEDRYVLEMEGKNFYAISQLWLADFRLTDDVVNMIQYLQHAHDYAICEQDMFSDDIEEVMYPDSEFVDRFRIKAYGVAYQHNLNWNFGSM